MKLIDHIQLNGWEVVKDDFINPSISLQEQADFLCDDMFQIIKNTPNYSIIIDIGWYGETTPLDGMFILYVVKDYDWDLPIFKYSSNNPSHIISMLKEITKLIISL